MTLHECYAALGGAYEEDIGRLRSERQVEKLVLRFLDDRSYELLYGAAESGKCDYAISPTHII